jgi:hypothetical protein
MSYVMVPVPEEHVLEVMQHVMRLVARASVVEWTDEDIEEFFRNADEPTRSLLSVTARATMAGKDLGSQEAADFLQLSARETSSIAREINELAAAAARPPIISFTQVTEELPSGRSREKRCMVMPTNLARMVKTAEAAVAALEPHPLETGAG